MFLGLELVMDMETKSPATAAASALILYCKEECRVLLSTDGPADNVIKIKPPMTFDMVDAEKLVSAVGRALAHLRK